MSLMTVLGSLKVSLKTSADAMSSAMKTKDTKNGVSATEERLCALSPGAANSKSSLNSTEPRQATK